MVEKKSFKPDSAQIEQLIANYQAPNLDEGISIDPSHAVTPLDDHFTCTICLAVAFEPKECSTCNKLNCTKCINDWLLKNQACPNCRADYKGDRVNQFVLKVLLESDFNCPKCKQSYKYKDAGKHFSQCSPPGLKCFLNCGHPEKIKGLDKMRSHFMTDCVNVMQICTTCEGKEPTSKIADHDCISFLKAKIQKKDEELARKNAENEALTKRISELELNANQKVKASQNQDSANFNAPRCSMGHLMRLTNTPIQRVTKSGSIGHGVNLRCNGCLQSYNIANGGFHCDHPNCDYDFCKNCGLRL